MCFQDQGHWILSLDIAFQLVLPSRFTYQKNRSYPPRAPNIKDSEQTWIFCLSSSKWESWEITACISWKNKKSQPVYLAHAFSLDHENKLAPVFQKWNNSSHQQAEGRADQEASLLTLSPVLCQAPSHGPHLRCSCQMGETDVFVTFTAQPFEFCGNERRCVPGAQKGGS